MTRYELKRRVNNIASHLTYPALDDLHDIDDHDAEQRKILDEQVEENRGLRADVLLMQKANAEQREEIRLLSEQVAEANKELLRRAEEIERLRDELAHWTFESFKRRESVLREALQGIIDIGKRDMTNPKYDGYFEAAKQALTREPT